MRICICGGGSLGHVCSGMLGILPQVEINIMTRKPEQWCHVVTVFDSRGGAYQTKIKRISNKPEDVLMDCDIILLCLPGYAIESELAKIKPYIGRAVVGSIVSSTGFFFAAHRILGETTKLFGFQRTPFIARTKEYGRSANLLGYKPHISIATENIKDKENFRLLIERLWQTPCKLLNSHYEVSLTNSNPILHTGRLFSLWKDYDGETEDHNILFYKEWTDEASMNIISMDEEFQQILTMLPVSPGAIPRLLDYYESHDVKSLTQKIQSITAFQNIMSPMKKTEKGWIPDFQSRYFTEDFPYGLRFIWQLAHKFNITTPTIDTVYEWGRMINQKYN